jgi:ERF superfamily
MGTIYHLGVEQFAQLARKAGWEFCGVQESIPPLDPVLVIQKWGITKRIFFDPNDFDPIKTATLLFAPTEKKMTDTPKLNLRQKLIQIYNELDHVDKAGRNSKQNYNFVRAADVMRPIRAAFAKWGIYAETNFEYLGSYDIKTNNGGNMHTASVKATIVLFDADSDETKTISGLGDGADGGDKGIYKAQTGALKNALRNGTLLPDEGDPNGGDPEADENVDDRTTGSYVHNSATTELPDFQESQHAAPKANPEKARPTAAAAPKPTAVSAPVADAPSKMETAPAAAPERGDAYEGPDDDGSMPTEAELTVYRDKFKLLGDDLSAKGKLKSSQGLPINRKLLVFLLSITKAPEAKGITKAQWINFFERVDAATANSEVGLVGLAKLVNKANGIEPKK